MRSLRALLCVAAPGRFCGEVGGWLPRFVRIQRGLWLLRALAGGKLSRLLHWAPGLGCEAQVGAWFLLNHGTFRSKIILNRSYQSPLLREPLVLHFQNGQFPTPVPERWLTRTLYILGPPPNAYAIRRGEGKGVHVKCHFYNCARAGSHK